MDTEPLGKIQVEELLEALYSGEKEKRLMQCVMCKRGEVRPAVVQAEIKLGSDRLLVPVEAEACAECGEAYYSTQAMRYLETVKEKFLQKTIIPPSVGNVYQIP